MNNFLVHKQPYAPYDYNFNAALYDSLSPDYNAIVRVNQQSVMFNGYGKGIFAKDFPVVTRLLNSSVSLSDGSYSFKDLEDLGMVVDDDRKIATNLYYTGLDTGDIPITTGAFVHGQIGFALQELTRFIVENGVIVEVNAQIGALHDNFDYESDNILIQELNKFVFLFAGPDYLPEDGYVKIQYYGGGKFDIITADQECFLAGTLITMADGTQKAIETISEDDTVLSYNDAGELVAGRVSKIFHRQAPYVLDVFGLKITPGHVTYCGDGRFAGCHVPIIDILRSDGALVRDDGTMIRAATGYPVGSFEDQFVQVVTGEVLESGQQRLDAPVSLRVGTRFFLERGIDLSIAEILTEHGGTLLENGLISTPSRPEGSPLYWSFTPELPEPETYVLQKSGVSLSEIYTARDWESMPPQMPLA